jgi:DNA-binding transcriptional LysR family regulator
MNRLVEMDAFVRVVKNGGFVAAATELGVSAGLITRRVKQLETDLGAILLTRTTRRLSLTEAGDRYYRFCVRILKEVHEEEGAIKLLQDEPVGDLKVVVPMSFGIMEVGKTAVSFMQEHPKIKITLIIAAGVTRAFDPAEFGADLAIAFVEPQGSTLHVRRLGSVKSIVCASPSYLRKTGTPECPSELARHSCLVTNLPFGDGRWQFSDASGVHSVEVTGTVLPSTAIAMRYMALNGVGIALLPAFCVADDIRNGRLVRILPSYSITETPILGVYPHGRQQPKKMHLLLEYLAARFKSDPWQIES